MTRATKSGSCEINKREVPCVRRRCTSSEATEAADVRSRPANGSSNTITRLRCANCNAREARRAIPPNNWVGRFGPSLA
eukprot:scaffold39452_cov40-Attheya_sp.AAC.4